MTRLGNRATLDENILSSVTKTDMDPGISTFLLSTCVFGVSENLAWQSIFKRSIHTDNYPQVASSGIIPERVSWHHVNSGRKFRGVDFCMARERGKTSEIGDYSMDRSNAHSMS
jgi:hypothetical protein